MPALATEAKHDFKMDKERTRGAAGSRTYSLVTGNSNRDDY